VRTHKQLLTLSLLLVCSVACAANPSPDNESTDSINRKRASIPDDVTMLPNLAYREGTGKAWKLDLITPKAAADSPRPCIVFIHGGGFSRGDNRDKSFLGGAIEYAQRGYVCATINYRLLDEAPFPAPLEDAKCAIRRKKSTRAAQAQLTGRCLVPTSAAARTLSSTRGRWRARC
jgi:acetyl esterase/lipase